MKNFAIYGCYKSGTTILSRILGCHSQVCCTNELGTFLDDKSFREKLQECINDNAIGYLRHLIYKIDNIGLKICSKELSEHNLLTTIQYTCKVDWYGDKHPSYIFEHEKVVEKLDAIIYIEKDPREVVSSWYRQTGVPISEIIDGKKFPNWFSFKQAWSQIKENLKIPYIEIQYNDNITIKVQKISSLLNIDQEELYRIFQRRWTGKKSEQVEVPTYWYELK